VAHNATVKEDAMGTVKSIRKLAAEQGPTNRLPESYPRPYKQWSSTLRDADHWRAALRHQVDRIRANAQLLDDVSTNRYDCKGGLEAFGFQVETLAGALADAADALNVWLDRSEPEEAAGGAR
jgi:hypothetical protein